MSAAGMDQIIHDYGADHPAVIERMVAEYGATVYRLALSILRDPADAQDAAQTTFVQAAGAIQRYQAGTNFKAWLMKIAVNTCRSTLRRRSARTRLQAAWLAFTGWFEQGPEVEAVVMDRETGQELWALVEKLDEKHRLVVMLRLGQGLSIDEISQILDVKEKTVYTQLYVAITWLKKQARLGPDLAPPGDKGVL